MPQFRKDQTRFAYFLIILVIFETIAVFTVMTWEHRDAERRADRKREERKKETLQSHDRSQASKEKQNEGLVDVERMSDDTNKYDGGNMKVGPGGDINEEVDEEMLNYIEEKSIFSKSAEEEAESDLYMARDMTISGRRLILPFLLGADKRGQKER